MGRESTCKIGAIDPIGFSEVMKILGKKRSTIYWYISEGKIKKHKNRLGHALFDRKEILKLLEVS